MTGHVTRIEQLELIQRLNRLERAVPVYLAALERIATNTEGNPQRIAARALREAEEPAE